MTETTTEQYDIVDESRPSLVAEALAAQDAPPADPDPALLPSQALLDAGASDEETIAMALAFAVYPEPVRVAAHQRIAKLTKAKRKALVEAYRDSGEPFGTLVTNDDLAADPGDPVPDLADLDDRYQPHEPVPDDEIPSVDYGPDAEASAVAADEG